MASAMRASGWRKPNAIEVMPDLGVDRLDAPVREAVLDSDEDRDTVYDHAALQVHERRDPGATGPADPDCECLFGLVVRELKTSRRPSLSR